MSRLVIVRPSGMWECPECHARGAFTRDGDEATCDNCGTVCGVPAPGVTFAHGEWSAQSTTPNTAGVPAGPPLHEQADRDADNVPSDEDRVREYAEAIRDQVAPDAHADWFTPVARAAMAVADREQAALHYERDVACASIQRQRVEEVATLRAEVERLSRHKAEFRWRWDVVRNELTEQEKDTETQLKLRLKAEATVARVEALTDEIERNDCTCECCRDDETPHSLRAALRGPEPTEGA